MKIDVALEDAIGWLESWIMEEGDHNNLAERIAKYQKVIARYRGNAPEPYDAILTQLRVATVGYRGAWRKQNNMYIYDLRFGCSRGVSEHDLEGIVTVHAMARTVAEIVERQMLAVVAGLQ